jgi:hypothetical protein
MDLPEAGSPSASRTKSLSQAEVVAMLKKIESVYAEHIAKIDALNETGIQKTQRRIRLDAQYLEAKQMAFGQMAQQAAVPEAARQRQESAASGQAAPVSADSDKIATETTLQKVAKFLEELNAKLPQPVLV